MNLVIFHTHTIAQHILFFMRVLVFHLISRFTEVTALAYSSWKTQIKIYHLLLICKVHNGGYNLLIGVWRIKFKRKTCREDKLLQFPSVVCIQKKFHILVKHLMILLTSKQKRKILNLY